MVLFVVRRERKNEMEREVARLLMLRLQRWGSVSASPGRRQYRVRWRSGVQHEEPLGVLPQSHKSVVLTVAGFRTTWEHISCRSMHKTFLNEVGLLKVTLVLILVLLSNLTVSNETSFRFDLFDANF